jgi:prepilin signal peptidase PulO-like enzyme (type II secretory pathway)
MSLPLALAAAALLCGLAVGLATNFLLKERVREAGALADWPADRPPLLWRAAPAAEAPALPPRTLLWLNPPLFALAGLAMSRLPGLQEPLALSQALLLLYVLVPLALVDLATLTIEPGLVVGGMALRMGAVLGLQRAGASDALGGLLAGAGLLAIVGFAYQWLRGREGLGEGDAAVLGLIGAFVGWRGILPVVLLATATGLILGVPALLALRRPLHTPLPFAPFLCAGGLAVYLAQVLGWSLFGLLPALP